MLILALLVISTAKALQEYAVQVWLRQALEKHCLYGHQSSLALGSCLISNGVVVGGAGVGFAAGDLSVR